MVLQEPGQQGAVSVCLRGCKLQGSMKTIQPTVKTLVWLSGAGVRSLWWGLGCYNLEQFLTRLIKIARRRSDHAACFVASSLLSPCKVGAAISSASQTVHLQANPDHESTSLVSPAINNMVHRDVRHLVPVAVWVRMLQGGPRRSRFWEVAECWGEPCSPTGNSEARRTCSISELRHCSSGGCFMLSFTEVTLRSRATQQAGCPGSMAVLPCDLTAGCISATCNADPWKIQCHLDIKFDNEVLQCMSITF